MQRHETSEDIDRAAAEWAARLDGGALTAADRTALDEWASADPRRFGALARAMALLAQFDAARDGADAAEASPFREDLLSGGHRRAPRFARRAFLYGGAAAGAAAISLSGTVAYAHRGQYRTGKGEVRSVPLTDGSVIWLNTDSVVRVRYGRTQRGVILARGEAMFEVAKDPARPFVVLAGETSVRAVGTAFSVSQVSNKAVQVLVNEGQVDFAPDGGQAVRLIPGCKALSGEPGGILVHHVGVPTVSRALSWRRGLLDFDGVTLSEAARTFARYSDEKILIDDPQVARRTVSGLFASTDPVGFARAVAVSLDLHAREASGAIHLSR